MTDLRERIIDAHGGRERWSRLARLMATLSMGGTEFLSHLQPRPFRDVEVTVDARCFRVSFHPFPQPGLTGIFEPRRVRIQNEDGQMVADRGAPGPITRSPRHWFLWDRLDLLFVAGLSVWHSLMLPLLLTRTGVTVEPLEPVPGDPERLTRCEIGLPADVPLLAPRQMVYADGTGLIRRVDLFPVAYRGWMRVGKTLDGHEAVEGLVVATRQNVYPCLPNVQLWRAARLIWLRFGDVSADMGEGRSAVPISSKS